MRDFRQSPISANERWDKSELTNAIQISSDQMAFLFFDEKSVTVQKGVIQFQIKGKIYYYTIYKKKVLEKVNFEKILVRYDLMDLSIVHLYTLDNIYLESIKPSPRAYKSSFSNTQVELENLKFHNESKSQLLEEFEEELNYFGDIVTEHETRSIPIELISPFDSKDDIDAADREYFVDFMAVVEEKDKKKKKNRIPKKNISQVVPSAVTMKEAAKKYQYQN